MSFKKYSKEKAQRVQRGTCITVEEQLQRDLYIFIDLNE